MYDHDNEALAEAERWLQTINLRKHRGNPQVRAAVHNARGAVAAAQAELEKAGA